MGHELHRFAWWLSHEPTAPSVLLQTICSVLSVAITAALCVITYHYMRLTRKLSETAVNQLRAVVRPIIDVHFSFGGGQDSAGAEVFKNQVYITITNTGSNPLIIKKATIRWEHSPQSAPLEEEVAAFRTVVISSRKEASHQFLMRVNGADPVVDHFPSWSDFVQLRVVCSDLGGLAEQIYFYENASGLTVG